MTSFAISNLTGIDLEVTSQNLAQGDMRGEVAGSIGGEVKPIRFERSSGAGKSRQFLLNILMRTGDHACLSSIGGQRGTAQFRIK